MFNIYIKNSQSSSGLIKYRDKDKTISRNNHLRIKRGTGGFFQTIVNFDFKPKHNSSKISFRHPTIFNLKEFSLEIEKANQTGDQFSFEMRSKDGNEARVRQTINLTEESLPSDKFLDSLEGPSSAKQLRPKLSSKMRLMPKRKKSKQKLAKVGR